MQRNLVTIEYKNTSKSKFTFTLEEIRIKIAEKDKELENALTVKALKIYDTLVSYGWTGITLRSNAIRAGHLRLNDSYKNKIATIVDNTVAWHSDKGTRQCSEN